VKRGAFLLLALLPALPLPAWVPPEYGELKNPAPHDGHRTWPEVRTAVERTLGLCGLNEDGVYNDMGPLDLNGTLTETEERTQIAVWSAMCSPMRFTGDRTGWRAATKALLESRDLKNVSQDVVGHQAYPVVRKDGAMVLLKDCWGLNCSMKVATFYNPTDAAVDLTLGFRDAELGGKVSVSDILDGTPGCTKEGSMTVNVPAHGVRMYRLFGAEALMRRRYEAASARRGAHGADLQFRHVYAPRNGTYALEIAANPDAVYAVEVNGLSVRTGCRGSVTLQVSLYRADNFIRLVADGAAVPAVEAIVLTDPREMAATGTGPSGLTVGVPLRKIAWERIDDFACGNYHEVKGPVRGIVIQHPWLGQEDKEPSDWDLRRRCTEAGVLYAHTKADPRGWMNDEEIALADGVVDALIGRFGLPADVPVVSCGMSMGAQGAIVFARYSRHNVVAAAANCPPCDLVYHYSERPDLPATFKHAFGDTPDLLKRLERHSPLHLVKELPDIDWFVAQSDADKFVSKTAHGDRFAAAMKGRPRFVYEIVPGRGHVDLGPSVYAKYCDFILRTAKGEQR